MSRHSVACFGRTFCSATGQVGQCNTAARVWLPTAWGNQWRLSQVSYGASRDGRRWSPEVAAGSGWELPSGWCATGPTSPSAGALRTGSVRPCRCSRGRPTAAGRSGSTRGSAGYVVADVTVEEQVAHAVEVAASERGRLDILFANAGGLHAHGSDGRGRPWSGAVDR